ncbi:PEP-CTERM sorting domain-containing protein [Planctomycetota bacterium]|nr:PEP-CTERM sorting domain-containing protein [Planctomycetota bacterium]
MRSYCKLLGALAVSSAIAGSASAATLSLGESIFIDVQAGDGAGGNLTGLASDGKQYNDVPLHITDGGSTVSSHRYIGTLINGLVTTAGAATSVGLDLRESFQEQDIIAYDDITGDPYIASTESLYANGSLSGIADSTGWFVDSAAKDMWQASGWEGEIEQNLQNSATVALTGLDAGALYDLKTFHSTKWTHKASTGGNSRDFRVIANGIEVYDNAYNGVLVSFDALAADENGEIIIEVRGGDWLAGMGASSRNYIYLNALSLSKVADIPEPASLALLGLGGLMILRRRA